MRKLIFILFFPLLTSGQGWFWASSQITDADALTFLNAVASGDTIRKGQAINTFVEQLKDSSLWTNYVALYPFYGGTATSAKYNIKEPLDADSAFRLTFYGYNDYTRGYQSCYSSTTIANVGYANTHITPSANLSRLDKHYVIKSNTSDARYCVDLSTKVTGNTSHDYIYPQYAGNKYFISVSSAASVTATASVSEGVFSLSRSNDSQINYYLNGADIGTNPKTKAASANQNDSVVYISWGNDFNTTYSSLRNYSIIGVGAGMSSAQISDENTVFANYDINMGRSVTNDYPSMLNYLYYRPTFKSVTLPDSVLISFANKENGTLYSYKGNYLYKSTDNGLTYQAGTIFFTSASKINFSYIFNNGACILTTYDNKVWYINSAFTTITETNLYHSDGSLYTFHVPTNPLYPGAYFDIINQIANTVIDGREIFVYGNYTNTDFTDGASAVNIYYSADSGKTMKTAFEFGVDPRYRDDGTATGGTTGTELGDTNQILYTRHVHSVVYIPYDTSFICYTGDGNNGTYEDEVMWLRGKYNGITDTWTWTQLIQGASTNRYKTGGIVVDGDSVMFVSDVTYAGMDYQRGLWVTNINDIADTSKCRKKCPFSVQLTNLVKYQNTLLAAASNLIKSQIYVSKDNGNTFNADYLTYFGAYLMPRYDAVENNFFYGTFTSDLYPLLGTYIITIR